MADAPTPIDVPVEGDDTVHTAFRPGGQVLCGAGPALEVSDWSPAGRTRCPECARALETTAILRGEVMTWTPSSS